MLSRAKIAADLAKAIRALGPTSSLLDAVRAGTISRDTLIQFLEEAIGADVDAAYAELILRIGDVPSSAQVSRVLRQRLFGDMTETTLALVQKVSAEGADDEQLWSRIRKVILQSTKDANALKAYDQELKTGNPRVRRRKLRDARYDGQAGKPVSSAKRRLMVEQYRRRLESHRIGAIARAEVRAAFNGLEFAHWEDRLAAGDDDARHVRQFWVNRGDTKVRHSHLQVPLDYPDGLPLGQTFVTEWGVMRYPLDSQGHPRDRDGCRCRPRFKVVRP